MPAKRLKADLLRLKPKHRLQMALYAEHGIRPQDPELIAAIAGDYHLIIENRAPDIADVIEFMEQHVPDFGRGTPERMARYEFMRKAITGGRAA